MTVATNTTWVATRTFYHRIICCFNDFSINYLIKNISENNFKKRHLQLLKGDLMKRFFLNFKIDLF